jgi:hypothetical protein
MQDPSRPSSRARANGQARQLLPVSSCLGGKEISSYFNSPQKTSEDRKRRFDRYETMWGSATTFRTALPHPDSDGRRHESAISVILRVRICVISLLTVKRNNRLARQNVAASDREHEVPHPPCTGMQSRRSCLVNAKDGSGGVRLCMPLYGRRDSRTTKPQQVQLIVVMAKITSAATGLFPNK